MKLVHEGNKFKCNTCDFEAGQRNRLEEHRKSKHKGMTYPCNHCKFETKVERYLRVHTQKNHFAEDEQLKPEKGNMSNLEAIIFDNPLNL